MKTQSGIINLIYVIFICFTFALFVNCSKNDTSVQDQPSQIKDSDNSNSENNNDTSNNSDGNGENSNNNSVISCGSAASFAGYGGYGSDGQSGTSDDPHIYSTAANSCGELEAFGHDDWEDFTFQTTSSSTSQNNDQVREVVESGGVCCVRDTSTTITNTNDENNNNNEYNFSERSENPPDLRHIIEQLAEQCPEQMEALSNGQESTRDLDFLDLVVEALREEDSRWGYTFWDGNPWAAPDVIGYYRGTGDPNGSNDMALLDYFILKTDNPGISWHIGTYEEDIAHWPNSSGEWRYPRPGATVSLSDCSGASGN